MALPPHSQTPLPDTLFKTVLDLAPDPAFLLGGDGRSLMANQAALRLLDREPGQILGQPLATFLPELAKATHRPGSLEAVLVLDGGRRIPLEAISTTIPGGGGPLVLLTLRDLSDRKAAEAALHKSESRYALAFNASPDAINLTRLEDGAYLEVSEGFERLTGWKRDEVLGRTSVDLGLWADPEERRKMAALLKEKGEFDGAVFHFRRKDGSPLRGMMSGRMVSLDGVPCLLTVTRDLTALAKAQQAVGNLTDLLVAIASSVQAFIAVLDLDGRLLYLNRVPEGYDLAAVTGKDFRTGQAEETRVLATQALAKILEGSERETYEGYGPGDRGQMRWFRCTLGPMKEDGRVVGATLIATDETERRLQEERQRESEERFRILTDFTPDALFWLGVLPDGEPVIEGLNPAARRALGVGDRDVAGLPLWEVCDPSMTEVFRANYRACLAQGQADVYEERVEGPEGPIHLSTTLVPIRDADGRVRRIVGSSRNTTEEHRMEEALRQAQKLESLGVLAGGIAHDFNNLLTAMMGNLNLAQLKLAEGSPALPHLEAVENTILKASELTRQMLAYSGKGRFAVKPQDLNEVVSEMIHLLKVTTARKGTLHVQLGAGLPAIEGDAAQIQQVIMNLVTNAHDALGERGGVIRLGTRAETLDAERIRADFPAQAMAPGTFVVLEVEDTGCGMSPEVQGRIFDPFFTTKARGRGLGLSAMLGILKGHGAGLLIRSRVGEGSLFQVYFPASGAQAAPRLEPAPKVPPRFSGKVLLVDDEIFILESIGQALQTLGFEVIEARDGVEALERFEAAEPDLVLMDLTMPRMDGATAFKRMRAKKPQVPVILSSGYDRQALEGVQPEAFVQKPYRLKDLTRLVQEVLAARYIKAHPGWPAQGPSGRGPARP